MYSNFSSVSILETTSNVVVVPPSTSTEERILPPSTSLNQLLPSETSASMNMKSSAKQLPSKS